jgi:hypothetical protein
MLSFTSLGVSREYAKSLFASSGPCRHRFFMRILLIPLNTGRGRTNYKFKFFINCLTFLLFAYMENTQNGEKSIKIELILVSNGST